MAKMYSAINPRNNYEVALFHDTVHNLYELCFRITPNSGMFRTLMRIDNIKDAYREYNDHLC